MGLALYPSLFSAINLAHEQFNRWEMMKKLEEQSLHSLVITQYDGYEWVDNKREIRINGKMFDVKEYHYDNGTLTVTGLFDSEEDELEKEVFVMMSNQKNRQHTTPNGFLLTILFNDLHKIQVTQPEIKPSATDFQERNYDLQSISLDKVSPPPRGV